MEFKNTTTLLYKNCIKRVKKELVAQKRHQYEIFPDDKSLVSTFFNYFNYESTPKNNPYLLPPVLVHRKPPKIESGIHVVLGMEIFEILWGNKNTEFKYNLPYIFEALLYDIYAEDSTVDRSIIDLVLCDYVPYAKYFTLSQIKKKESISLLSTFAVYDFEVETKYMIERFHNALCFLYKKENFRADFEDTFIKFCQNLNSYSKLPNKLEKFANNELIKLFERHKPSSNSLGFRVKKLIENDLSNSKELLTHSSNREFKVQEYYTFELNRASSSYITELEKIQNICLDDAFSDVWEF